jgi:ABC-type phosphate transport system auxiliary subunit
MSDTDVILTKLQEMAKQSEKNQEALNKKLDALDTRLDKVDIAFAVQDTRVSHHVIKVGEIETRVDDLNKQIEPLKSHMMKWAGAGKLLTLLSMLGGTAAALLGLRG